MMRLLLRLSLVLALLAPVAAYAEDAVKIDHRAIVAEIVATGDKLVGAYSPESGKEAAVGFSDLYFDVFEATGLETDVALGSASDKSELESYFSTLGGLAKAGAPKEKLEETWKTMKTRLTAITEHRMTSSGGWVGALSQSILILLREGVEAMLVVGALVTYLKRIGADSQVRVVWWSVVAALVASAITAWLMMEILKMSGQDREAVEGVTMVIATCVLIYVSHWLFARREAQRWQGYIQGEVNKAVAGGHVFSMGFAAFLAVYREGAETVIFYQALLGSYSGQTGIIAIGFGIAAVALLVLYLLVNKFAVRLPLKPFFTVTAILLFVLAFSFAGKAVLELQVAGWIANTKIALPTIEILGIFPSRESVLAQLAVLATLVPVFGIWLVRRKAKTAS